MYEDATYNIRKLLAGRVDLIIGNRGSIQNIIDQRFPLEAQRIRSAQAHPGIQKDLYRLFQQTPGPPDNRE